MADFRALVVDFGGVLTSSIEDSFRVFAEEHDVERAHLREMLFAGHNEGRGVIRAIETGSVSLDEFEQELAGRIQTRSGDPLEAAGLVRRMFAGSQPDHRMIEALRQARAAGLRTALLSNSWGNRDTYNFEHFDTLFDVVVLSGERGMRKPDREIFELTARELGVEPAECVFVDDLEPNIRGAVATGMCGVHHTSTDETLRELSTILGLTLS